MLSWSCFKGASTLVKAISQPICLVISIDMQIDYNNNIDLYNHISYSTTNKLIKQFTNNGKYCSHNGNNQGGIQMSVKHLK